MEYTAYIGSYSKVGQIGIQKIATDGRAYTVIANNNEIENPSYLALSGQYLYAVSEVSSELGSELIVLDKDNLSILQRTRTNEGGACHIFISQALSNAYISNYDSGTTTVFKLKDGLVSGKHKICPNRGSNPKNPRQTSPHAHFITATSSPFRLCSVDLGADNIFIYNASPDGRLNFISHCKLPLGSGPRHAVFKGETAFILTELSNEIYICDYHAGSGSLWPKSKISTLPSSNTVDSTAAAIKLSPDGKHLFITNRGHDSIATFRIDDSSLELISITSCGGTHPRDIAISPDGKLLICTNTYSDSLTAFAINDGQLQQISTFNEVTAPSCVIFE